LWIAEPIHNPLSTIFDLQSSIAEPTCKPNSVPAPTLRPGTSGDHSSGGRITAPLLRPTRKRAFQVSSLKLWDLRFKRTEADRLQYRFPIWPCTAGGLPSRACRQTRWWSLYLTVSPSPTPLGRRARSGCLFSVALFRRVTPPGR